MQSESENFDVYADDYSRHVTDALPAGFGDVDKYARIKADHLTQEMREIFGARRDVEILDAGCGIGLTDSFLKAEYGNITGFDVSLKSLEIARLRNPELKYAQSDDGTLPFEDGSFDVVFAICVVHHVPPALWAKFFSEMKRVLRHGGLLAIYEHNPWNPLTRRVVANVEFDRDAVLLTGGQCARLASDAGLVEPRCRYILFAPTESPAWVNFERRFLSRLPIGAQYQCTARRAC